MFAPESVELLQKSGIDFQRHEEIGILPNDFAELMITSGMVLTDDTKWISFHRCVIRALLILPRNTAKS
jgi:CCR4-NOT transcription complex subunit 7/8